MRHRTPSSRLRDIEDAAAPPPVGQLYSVRAQDLPGLESGTHYLVRLPGFHQDSGAFHVAILSADGTFVRHTRASKPLLCASRALSPDDVAESVRQGARDILEVPTPGWKNGPRRPEGVPSCQPKRRRKDNQLSAAEAAELNSLVECRPRGLNAQEALRQAQAEGLQLRTNRTAVTGFVGVYKASSRGPTGKFKVEISIGGERQPTSDRRTHRRKCFGLFDTAEEAALVLARVLAAVQARRRAARRAPPRPGPAVDSSEGMVYVEAESADDSDYDEDGCVMVSAVEIGEA